MPATTRPTCALAAVLLLAGGATLAAETAPEKPAATAAPAEGPAVEQGRRFTRQLYDGELVTLQAAFSEAMQGTFDLATLDGNRSTMLEQLGTEVELLDESVRTEGEYTIYVRQARYSKQTEPFELHWAWNEERRVVGFLLKRAASSR